MNFWCKGILAFLLIASSYLYASNDVETSIGFPDFGFMVPADDYQGSVFRLKTDFPLDHAEIDDELKGILSMDVKNKPIDYLVAVRNYVFQGNIFPGDAESDFTLFNNKKRDWYHVPWQHYGPNGREGYRGLTREGPLAPLVLAKSQESKSSAYAVGFYNSPGGFGLGKVWPSADESPDLSWFADKKNGGFPNGTVVAKFLFTVLDESEVPYLANPLQWNAYIVCEDIPNKQDYSNCKGENSRQTVKVNLLQMDIMVRDTRFESTGGWIFGNFAYNGNKDPETYKCDTSIQSNWCNLVPVGVMWGNDPEYTLSSTNPKPVETIINYDLRQTYINPDNVNLPAMHLGWGSRLNGPADNPSSSCMSCHSTSQFPSVSAIMPQFNNPAYALPAAGTNADENWMKWYRNIKGTEAFDEGKAIPLDYSLQMLKSIENYVSWKSESEQGLYSVEYQGNNSPVSRNIIVE